MRTALFLVAGLVLLAACLGGAHAMHLPVGTASVAFLLVWFIAAGVNLWNGVRNAGYSLREELPIFLLIFGAPALVCAVAWWKIGAGG